jgi:hypothetical protein
MRHPISRLVAFVSLLTVLVVTPAAVPAATAASASIDCATAPASAGQPTAPLQSYTAINPQRLVDTRNNIGGVRGEIPAGCTMRVSIGADIPTWAKAVALSMTTVTSVPDYLTVYPCAAGRPETSNLNSRAGGATPNLVVAIPDANREICIFSHGRTHLIIDLSGWWSEGPDRFGSIVPERVYDSRQPGFTALSRFQVREITIPAAVIPANSTAAAINLTAANAVAPGYMTAFPCGQPAPVASNVNFFAGEARAVGAIVGLGAGNTLCVIADTTVHVIVDVTGFYAPAPGFGPTAVVGPDVGRRVVDSRNGIGGPRSPLAAGEVRSFDPVAGLANAADASAVMVNIISTDAAAPGFLTAYPCGRDVPDVSTLNFVTAEAATNLATVELGTDLKVCVVSSVATNVIVDVFAVMTAPPGSPLERLGFDKTAWPPFNPAATDYVIECRAGSGTSTVTMNVDLLAFTTATLSVSGGAPTPLSTGATSFPLRADEPAVVSTNRQGVVRDYHFRCVPNDFPRLEVLRPGNPTPGWYLTTSGVVAPNPATNGPFLLILDHYGAPVWYKRTPSGVVDFKRLSDGRFTFTPASGPFGVDPAQGYWLIPDLQGTGTIRHRTSDPVALPTDHHDYIELPSGPNARALISYPVRTHTGTISNCTTPAGAPAPSTKFTDGVIEEVNGDGSSRWTWTMSAHFDPASTTFGQNFETLGFPGTGCDVFHINAIDRESDGDYIVTARHMDGAFRVDYPSGNVLWTLGTPPSTDPGAKVLTIEDDPFNGPKRPHDARLNGNVLTMLDNRANTGQPSRAVAYAIDEAAGTATFLWQFTNSAVGGATLGSAQQAADGSVLVNWGAGQQPFIEELAPNGTRLMAIGLPNSGNSYRTIKYAPATFTVAELRANAGGSVASPP